MGTFEGHQIAQQEEWTLWTEWTQWTLWTRRQRERAPDGRAQGPAPTAAVVNTRSGDSRAGAGLRRQQSGPGGQCGLHGPCGRGARTREGRGDGAGNMDLHRPTQTDTDQHGQRAGPRGVHVQGYGRGVRTRRGCGGQEWARDCAADRVDQADNMDPVDAAPEAGSARPWLREGHADRFMAE